MWTRSSTGFNTIPENVAAVVLSHLTDPEDRVRLAAVSKVWRDAEKGGVASLPGTPSELSELGQEFRSADEQWKAIYWFEKSADHGDPEGMYWLAQYTAYSRSPPPGVCVRCLHGRKKQKGGALVEKGVRAGARRSDQNGRYVLRGRPRRGDRRVEGDRVARESGGVG